MDLETINVEKIEKVDEETIQKAVSSGCKTPQKFKNCYIYVSKYTLSVFLFLF